MANQATATRAGRGGQKTGLEEVSRAQPQEGTSVGDVPPPVCPSVRGFWSHPHAWGGHEGFLELSSPSASCCRRGQRPGSGRCLSPVPHVCPVEEAHGLPGACRHVTGELQAHPPGITAAGSAPCLCPCVRFPARLHALLFPFKPLGQSATLLPFSGDLPGSEREPLLSRLEAPSLLGTGDGVWQWRHIAWS